MKTIIEFKYKSAAKVLILCLLLSFGFSAVSAQDNSTEPATGQVIVLQDGKPTTSVECGAFQKLTVKFGLPTHLGSTYDRIKFTVTIGDEEYRTKNYLKSEIYYLLSHRSTKEFNIANADSSDFEDLANKMLSAKRLCVNNPTKPVDGYELKIEAKGYKIDKKDKKGKPIYADPEIFAQGKVYIKLLPPETGSLEKR
jgi:hypothetical protein